MKMEGYRRTSGKIGIRNYLVVIPTVSCANNVVGRICEKVDGAIPITHNTGCAQAGKDLEQTRRTIMGFAKHPNVGAVLLVSLGCESLKVKSMAEELENEREHSEYIVIQKEGGTTSAVKKGVKIIAEFKDKIEKLKKEKIGVEDLIVGTECGGSDAYSGITANPAIGKCSDMIVNNGGTVLLSETTEFIGAEKSLAKRADNKKIEKDILRIVNKIEQKAIDQGIDLRGAQPSPGNIEGGLTTIEEKSLGCIYKGGTTTVKEVVDYAETPNRKGLVVMDTPGYDVESITGMVAGGAHLILFSTGRGTPTGCPIAPVIKISTNTKLYNKMKENIDLDAGKIIEDKYSLDEFGGKIYHYIEKVVNGTKPAAESFQQRDFAINRIGHSY